jgi:glycerate-2-kinase
MNPRELLRRLFDAAIAAADPAQACRRICRRTMVAG